MKTLNTLFEQFKTNSRRENAPTFGYNNRTKKIFINLNHGDRITFKPKLASILGITDNPSKPIYCEGEKEKWHADEIFDIDGNLNSLYVYCDILEHVPVGDTLAPLLRPVVVRGKPGDQISEKYINSMYLPVQKKSFDSIEINIMTDTGDPAPFVDGPSTVTLHFRRASNPYFLSK